MPANSNNPNIYNPLGQVRTDKAPDFGDFLNAAAQKQQDRPPENRPPERVKRVYSLSPGQKKSLRRKYGSARFSRFEIVIDRDRIYCNNPTLTEFTRQLWEMGMLTPEEAELGAGKRPLPRDVFIAERGESALISAGDEYLYESSGWIDLLYPRKIPESVSDYFAHQEIVLNTLRIYLSNPAAAISLWGEYFAFDPFQIKECLGAVKKISSVWADTAMKDKGALYSKKRTFYRERPSSENIGNIIDTKLPVRKNDEPYISIPKTSPKPDPAGMHREPSEYIPEKDAHQNGYESAFETNLKTPSETGGNKAYKSAPSDNSHKSTGEFKESFPVHTDAVNSGAFERATWEEAAAVKGKDGVRANSGGAKSDTGAYNVQRENSSRNANSPKMPSLGNISENAYKNNSTSTASSGSSAEFPKSSPISGSSAYGKPPESDAFREVSPEEAGGNAPAKELPSFKEIPRDTIVHHGAADRAKAYREIPGERSGRIEPPPESYKEPARKSESRSGKGLLQPPRPGSRSAKEAPPEKAPPKEPGTVAAYQEMFKERSARKRGEKEK